MLEAILLTTVWRTTGKLKLQTKNEGSLQVKLYKRRIYRWRVQGRQQITARLQISVYSLRSAIPQE